MELISNVSSFFFFGLEFIAGLSSLVLSLIIWVIVRRNQKKEQLPILRIFPKKDKKLFNLVPRKKSILKIIPLIICAAILCLSLLQPGKNSHSFNREMKNSHILVDLSPSVSSRIDLVHYAAEVGRLWRDLKSISHVSISTTHSSKVWYPKDEKQVKKKIFDLGFHRSGSILHKVIDHQWREIRKANRLVIVSDRDAYSWKNFDWRSLEQNLTVYSYFQGQENGNLNNVYFSKIEMISGPLDDIVQARVTITRTNSEKESLGKVRVFYEKDQLAEEDWFLQEGKSSQEFILYWKKKSREREKQSLRFQTNSIFSGQNRSKNPPYRWDLTSVGRDAIDLDNTLYFDKSRNRGQKAFFGIPTQGEHKLEDPFRPLEIIFKLLGIEITRFSPIASSKQDKSVSLWVLSPQSQRDISQSCFYSDSPRHVLLIPMYENHLDSLKNLCICGAKILGEEKLINGGEQSCSSARNAQSLKELLLTGRRQETMIREHNSQSTIGWQILNRDVPTLVSLFLTPLDPARVSRIYHGTFPHLIREVLYGKTTYSLASQPLFSYQNNIAIHRGIHEKGVVPIFSQDYLNTPSGESLLLSHDQSELPPVWKGRGKFMEILGIDSLRLSEESWVWVFMMNVCLLVILTLEIFVNHRYQVSRKRDHL